MRMTLISVYTSAVFSCVWTCAMAILAQAQRCLWVVIAASFISILFGYFAVFEANGYERNHQNDATKTLNSLPVAKTETKKNKEGDRLSIQEENTKREEEPLFIQEEKAKREENLFFVPKETEMAKDTVSDNSNNDKQFKVNGNIFQREEAEYADDDNDDDNAYNGEKSADGKQSPSASTIHHGRARTDSTDTSQKHPHIALLEKEWRAMTQPQLRNALWRSNRLRSSLLIAETVAAYFNTQFPLRNLDAFPFHHNDPSSSSASSSSSSSGPSLAIVMLVWKRVSYLKMTIELLRRAKGIEDVTLIVSYDGVYKEVAEAIASIDFCRVKEIVYPWNRSWLDDFDSHHQSNDNDNCCNRRNDNNHNNDSNDNNNNNNNNSNNKNKNKNNNNNKINNNHNNNNNNNNKHNNKHKDSISSPRGADVAAAIGCPRPRGQGFLKHHLLWALTQAWENTQIGNDSQPFDEIVYIEDDIYVTRDFVAATRALSRVREEHCRECMGSTVGWHGAQEFARRGKSPLLTQLVCQEQSSMAAWSLSRRLWHRFRAVVRNFCVPNTRHWDDSLYLLQRPGCCVWSSIVNDTSHDVESHIPRLIEPLYLRAVYPRAWHAGACYGLHYNKQNKEEGRNCSAEYALEHFYRYFAVDVYKEYVKMMKSVLVLESEQQELEEREFSFLSPDYNARMRKQQILEKCRQLHSSTATFGTFNRRKGSLDVPSSTYDFCVNLSDPLFVHINFTIPYVRR